MELWTNGERGGREVGGGLKRERGLATPLPIHWPIILTNGLCSHRALCFHSLPRWAKIELRPETSIERRFKEGSLLFRDISLEGLKKEELILTTILSWKDPSNLRKRDPTSMSIVYRREREREREMVVEASSLVSFRNGIERNLLNIVRRKIVFPSWRKVCHVIK